VHYFTQVFSQNTQNFLQCGNIYISSDSLNGFLTCGATGKLVGPSKVTAFYGTLFHLLASNLADRIPLSCRMKELVGR
jgi:hypothetical protein